MTTRRASTPAALLASLALAPLALTSPAAAQDTLPAPTTTMVRYLADSGPLANAAKDWAVVYTHQLHLPGAQTLRLHFAQADLPDASFLLVTSLRDGEQHRLDAADLATWSSSTAYFNGDTVLLELHAAPGSAGHTVRIERVEAAFGELPPEHPLRGDPGECGICGTDDRSPTNLTFAARLMPVGCTASIVCEDNTALTAGHCLGGGAQVMQFNVPSSLANCALIAPPAADQFPVLQSTIQGVNGGVGNDWGVFRVGNNGSAAGPFQRYGQLRRVAAAPPPNGSIINIFGYGADNTCTRNQVQQRSVGALTSVGPAAMTFDADVRGGNSGSSVLSANEVIGIVSHCAFGCGGNVATRIDLPAFRNAINAVTTCDHRIRVTAANTLNQPLAINITFSPTDNNGNTSGATPMERIFAAPANVTLTAPETSGVLCFSHWERDGVTQPGGASLSFPLSGVVLATARYSADACSCDADWNSDTLVNSGDITAFLTDWLASIQNGTLVADFNGDGQVNSGDITAFLSAWLDAVQNGC